jgi:hypothetical protein
MKKRLPIILTLLLVCIAVSYASAANVVASPQNLSVDGVDADCDKYNIDGSNYFKLRDLAQLLSKTDSRFSVSFDEQSNAVTVVSGKESAASLRAGGISPKQPLSASSPF